MCSGETKGRNSRLLSVTVVANSGGMQKTAFDVVACETMLLALGTVLHLFSGKDKGGFTLPACPSPASSVVFFYVRVLRKRTG